MAQFEYWVKSDLKKAVTVREPVGVMFTRDKGANKIGAEVYSDGEPVTLSGNVVGYCVLATGVVVAVPGTRSDNKAYIVLPESAYAVPGRINIVIKLDDGNQITTLAAIVTSVFNTREEAVLDPGDQQIADWTAQITNTLALIAGTSVRYDQAQSLTTAQKEQARINIGAHATSSLISGSDYKVVFP